MLWKGKRCNGYLPTAASGCECVMPAVQPSLWHKTYFSEWNTAKRITRSIILLVGNGHFLTGWDRGHLLHPVQEKRFSSRDKRHRITEERDEGEEVYCVNPTDMTWRINSRKNWRDNSPKNKESQRKSRTSTWR